MATVKLDNLNKFYLSGKKLVHAVKNLSIDIMDGELLAILGPSGCGKSSTMRMISGLESITEGELYIDGVLMNDKAPDERNVAQAFESYALYQHLTVRENIGFCLHIRKYSQKQINEQIDNVANLFGIKKILDLRPGSLSGGEQQLVSLARSLVRVPAVTLLDEPISHLDTRARLKTSSIIRKIHNETNLTMIYVTHNQEEATALADRIAVMNMSELQQIGTMDELLNKPKNVFVADFAGEPPINFLNVDVVRGKKGLLVLASKESGKIFELTDKQSHDLLETKKTEAILGLRPIDLYGKSSGNTNTSIKGIVVYSEFLGEVVNTKFSFDKNESFIAALAPLNRYSKGDSIELFYDKQKLHIFDVDTKKRLID